MEQIDKDIKAAKHFQRHPWEWVQAMWGDDPEYKHSAQQEDYFIKLGEFISAKLDAYAKKKLTDIQKKLAEKIGISVMSGQGTGKDAVIAQTALFFLYCFCYPKIPCTAPSGHQLKDVLWAEISKWIRKSRKVNPDDPKSPTILSQLFEWQSDKVFLKEKKGKEWFAVARTVNTRASDEEQAETLAGFHEDYLIYLIDEAAGVARPVFRPIEGSLTGKLNIAIMIFNPTRNKSFAVESHFGDSKRWITLRWNAEESELVTRAHIESYEQKYGRDSNPFRIRVLGLPPTSDVNSLIPYEWVMDAVDREIKILESDPVILGVDVGAGGDKSVIAKRQGGVIVDMARFNTSNEMELVGHIARAMDEHEAKAVCIDSIGIGSGVAKRLREYKKGVYSVDVRRSPRDDEKFQRLRDELWWKVREEFENGTISIPNDEALIDQFSAIRWGPDSGGKVKIDSKKVTRKFLKEGGSPDEADAVCCSYYVDDAMFRPQDIDDYDKDIDIIETGNWMVA